MKAHALYFLLPMLVSVNLLTAQTSLTVSGEVTKPLALTMADLSKMKQATATLKDKDGKDHVYKGVAITDILNLAGVSSGKELHGKNLAKYMIVKCADGYEVVFALAELDPSFTDRIAILAAEMDGKPLPADRGPFRLIFPGEKRPARSCYQVVEFVIKVAKA